MDVGTIESRHEAGVRVVALSGEHDLSTRPAIAEAIDAPVDVPTTAIVMDFSATDFVDSTIVTLVVEKQRAAAERGLEFSVVAPPDGTVARTFELLALGTLVPIHPTVADAVAAGGPHEAGSEGSVDGGRTIRARPRA